MKKSEWMEKINLEDIPETYLEYAKLIGAENFIKLAMYFGGTTIYLPKASSLTIELRNRKIMKEFDGTNYKQLAKKYDMCETWIRNIINKKS